MASESDIYSELNKVSNDEFEKIMTIVPAQASSATGMLCSGDVFRRASGGFCFVSFGLGPHVTSLSIVLFILHFP